MIHLPEQFVDRIKKMLGEEEWEQFLSSYDAPRHQGLRFNPLKTADLPAFPGFLSAEGDEEAAGVYGRPDPLASEGVRRPGENETVWEDCKKIWHLRPVPWAQPYGFYYTEGDADASRPGKSPLHEAGAFYIQEPSAMAVAALSGARPGEKVLDLCAAPGGKSTQLAGMLQGKGLLVSNEINPGRAKILSQNIERMGVRNAIVTNEDSAKLAERFGSFFDRVIVDAPCSGEGMFRKEEQALAMWSQANVEMCAGRQAEILDNAARMVKSGGVLVYSTCTFSPEEDEGSAASFLIRHPEFELVDLPAVIGKEKMGAWGFDTGRPEWWNAEPRMGNHETPGTEDRARLAGQKKVRQSLAGTLRLWPHRLEGEGHFIALFRKEGRLITEVNPCGFLTGNHKKVKAGNTPRENIPAGNRNKGKVDFRDFLTEEISPEFVKSLAVDSASQVMRNGDHIMAVPFGGVPDLSPLHVLRPGLELGIAKNGRFEPSHSLAMALRPSEVRQSADYARDSREAAAFLHGESVPCDPSLKGWTLVTVNGVSMGWGKASGGILKNHYPKGLRRPY